MLRSMFSAISGLKAHQMKMDVTGNNIANVNTVGFKSSATVFQDTLSQVVRAGGAPAEARGGTNPAQVGLGVKLAGITTNWTQGASQSTGRSTDFMIEGDGFFVTRGAGDEQLYTRAGSFEWDGTGRLVTPDGGSLQGWMAGPDGEINPNSPVGDLRVVPGQIIAPVATTTATVLGNLDADAPVPTSPPAPTPALVTSTTIYDTQGAAYQITYSVTKTADNTWELDITGPPVIDPITGAVTPGAALATDGQLEFHANGELKTPAAGTVTIDPTGIAGWAATTPPAPPITIDIGELTQYGGSGQLVAAAQDGFALGTLESFSLSNDGTIVGTYSNDMVRSLGRLALASFNNPGGLEKAGNSSFRVGANAGVAVVGMAGEGGRGVLVSGALEMSNVDLAEEFTGLIVAQRGFQANSRVITASDELLQDLVNLKR